MKLKKILGVFILTLCLMLSGLAFAACGGDEILEISNVTGFNQSVQVGVEYDTSEISITIKYKSGKTEVVDNSKLTFSTLDTSTAGTKQLTVTYKDFSINVNVLVYENDEIVEITQVSGVKQTVHLGDEYDYSTITATVTYQSGRTETIQSSALSFSGLNTSVSGNQTLVISYQEFTYEVNVLVYENDDVTSATLMAGTYATTVGLGAEYDTSNIQLKLTYISGREEIIPASQLTITEIDTTTIGTQELKVTYGQTEVKVNVQVQKNYMVIGYDDPGFVAVWERNSQVQNTFNKTGSNGTKGFAVVGNDYLVGNDNEFAYAPTLSVYFTDTRTAGTLDNYKANYKVYLHGTGEPTLLAGAELANYVTIDDVKHTLLFSDAAIGKKFTISVLPTYATEDELDEISASEFTFKVVDGYNVYTAADLSILDNVNSEGKWTALKQANGLVGVDANALILQSNITINASDIPSVHFYTAAEVAGDSDADRAVGSLKDTTGDYLGRIYHRRLASGTFTVEGNYYQISAQNIPLIVRENGNITNQGESMTTHTTMFAFDGDSDTTAVPNYVVNNLSLYGNTKKTENAALSGGVLMMKKVNAKFTANNCLAQCWFISFFNDEGAGSFEGQEDKVTLTLKSCNSFDAYNTLIYNYAGILNIEDCVLIGAGGPVMICDHVGNNATTAEGGMISQVTTKNSVLESYVAGTEGWFNAYDGASDLAALIKALDRLFNQYGVTILDSSAQKMNLVAVYKSSSAEGLTTSSIRGSFAVADHEEEKAALLTKLETLLQMALAAPETTLTEDIVEDVMLSATHLGLDMDITAASFRHCLNSLVEMHQIPDQASADYLYAGIVGDKNVITQQELGTALEYLVANSILSADQAQGIYIYAKVCAIGYGRGELETVLGGLKDANMLTEEEVGKILLYAQKADLDAARNDILTYLQIIHALGQMSDGEYTQALGAIFAQTINGAFGLTSTSGWALEPSITSALTSVTFTNACEYLYIYLPNGMSVVFTLSPYQAA